MSANGWKGTALAVPKVLPKKGFSPGIAAAKAGRGGIASRRAKARRFHPSWDIAFATLNKAVPFQSATAS